MLRGIFESNQIFGSFIREIYKLMELPLQSFVFVHVFLYMYSFRITDTTNSKVFYFKYTKEIHGQD